MYRGLTRAVLGIAATLALSTSARAQESDREVRAHFQWRAPPGCVNDGALVRSVETLLKRKVFVEATAADVLVEGEAELRSGGGWNATLHMRAADGRELGVRSIVSESSDCRAVEGPLAVVLALLVDLERREIALHVPEAPPQPAKPAPRPVVEPKPIAPAKPTPTHPWHGATSFGAVAAWGLLPDLALGVAARGQVETLPELDVGLELSVWPEKRSDDAGPGGGFSAWLVTALGCRELVELDALEAYGCVGFSSGVVSATGVGLATAQSPARFHANASLRGGASLGLTGPIALALELGLAASFSRPRFFYEEANGNEIDVHRSSVLVPLGGIFLRADL